MRIHAPRARTRKKSYWGRPSKSSLHVFCEAYPGARTANILLENYLGKKKSSSKNFTSQVFLGVFVWQFLGLKGIKQGNFWKILAGQTFNLTILTCFLVNTYVRKNPGAETPTNYFLQNHLVRKIGGKHFIFVPRLFLVGNSGGGLQNHICGVLVRKSGQKLPFFLGWGQRIGKKIEESGGLKEEKIRIWRPLKMKKSNDEFEWLHFLFFLALKNASRKEFAVK